LVGEFVINDEIEIEGEQKTVREGLKSTYNKKQRIELEAQAPSDISLTVIADLKTELDRWKAACLAMKNALEEKQAESNNSSNNNSNRRSTELGGGDGQTCRLVRLNRRKTSRGSLRKR
jgi:hypothetical protein